MVLSSSVPFDAAEGLRCLLPISQEVESREFSLLLRCVLHITSLDLDNLLASLTKPEIDKPDKRGWTACHWAARRGDITSLTLLLQYGADIEKQNQIHERAINSALRSQNPACVLLLLDHGCETNFVNVYGWSPLHGCCYAGFEKNIIDEFIRKGADVNIKSGNDVLTPLMYAAEQNRINVVKHLLLRGAEINATDRFGRLALHVAITFDHPGCIQRLVEHGASLTATTNALESVLHYAAQWAGLESLAVLHCSGLHGVDVDARVGAVSDFQIMKVKGLTALEIAERRQDVTSEWLEMFRKLVERIRDPQNKAPLAPVIDEEDEFYDAHEHWK